MRLPELGSEAPAQPVGDALKTYRYLRLGMIGAVVLLATSVIIEISDSKPACVQPSISSYYYTNVRPVFVGCLLAVGVALIVLKSRGPLEDAFLNLAGMLAPVVALVPTTNVGECHSTPSPEQPTAPSSAKRHLASWAQYNVHNNFRALIFAGLIALGLAYGVTAWLNGKHPLAPLKKTDPGTSASLIVAVGLMLVALGWYYWRADGFENYAHVTAAYSMFGCLVLAVICKVISHNEQWMTRLDVTKRLSWVRNAVAGRSEKADRGYFRWYVRVALLMTVGAGLLMLVVLASGKKSVLTTAVEAWEIALFMVFWLVQTAENWDEDPGCPPPPSSPAAAA